MSIGAVKGVEIGDGNIAAIKRGSENNDNFVLDKNGKIKTSTNHSGGILGGISNSNEIILRASFKATPSILKEQMTVNKNNDEISVSIKGRHDPVIVPRAVVVVEAMSAITLLDAMLVNMSATLKAIQSFYK